LVVSAFTGLPESSYRKALMALFVGIGYRAAS
jgi:hypothetical protein